MGGGGGWGGGGGGWGGGGGRERDSKIIIPQRPHVWKDIFWNSDYPLPPRLSLSPKIVTKDRKLTGWSVASREPRTATHY